VRDQRARTERRNHPRVRGSSIGALPDVLTGVARERFPVKLIPMFLRPTSTPPRTRGTPTATTRTAEPMASSPSSTGIDLSWLPLGAGGHSVRMNGRVFEALVAGLERRDRCDLYHSALEVHVPEGRFVIEMTPIRAEDRVEVGVVAEGAVGAHAAGRFRLFRYEVRLWRGGVIPDVAKAVESPHRLSDDPDTARRLLDLVPQVPTPVWGRDELRAGEMWNSNSLVSWLIARSGLDVEPIRPPVGGRAPGWRSGIVVARRPQAQATHSRLAA
jgi:hypothetical protein